MDIHKMNSEYPKTLLKSRKQFGYCILKVLSGVSYIFETYANVSTIYLKHYCKNKFKNLTLI